MAGQVVRKKAILDLPPEQVKQMYQAAEKVSGRFYLAGHDHGDLVQYAVFEIVRVIREKGIRPKPKSLAWYKDVARKAIVDYVTRELAQKRKPDAVCDVETAFGLADPGNGPDEMLMDEEMCHRIRCAVALAKRELGEREGAIIDLKLNPPDELIDIDESGRDLGTIKNISVCRYLGITKNQMDHSMVKIRAAISAALVQIQEKENRQGQIGIPKGATK